MATRIARPWRSESRWKRAVAVAAVLLIGSIVPSPFDRHSEWKRFGPDKILHLIGHGGLAVALADAMAADGVDERSAGVLAVVGSIAYGVAISRIQERVPGREHETADVVAGALGSLLGTIGWALLDIGDPATVIDDREREPVEP